MKDDIKKTLQSSFPKIEELWDKSIIPTLCEYVKIPNKSIVFDKDWKANGYMDQAMKLIVDWCQQHALDAMSIDLLESPGRTPLLFIEIEGQSDDTVLFYGHMDKQPEMRGWDEGKGPWEPVIENGKLYGRGAADDGYSVFTAMTAISMLQKNSIPHPHCLILIEASEESGSVDLEHYLEQLKDRINTPSLVIGLDSSIGSYDQLWSVTSLRGIANGSLNIKVLDKGMHSGLGSGIVPSVFDILSSLTQRIEDFNTGQVTLEKLLVDTPKERITEAKMTAKELSNDLIHSYQFADNTKPISNDITELLINRSWRPTLSITGVDGVPALKNAGNVTLPKLTVKLSLRLPPTVDIDEAQQTLKETFEASPPFNASVTYTPGESGTGWNSPTIADWLLQANEEASQLFYGKSAQYIGEGGTIPFMGMLGNMFPKAQFLVTGVLGPLSNAHGPNEFLHIGYAKKLTGCVAYVLAMHYQMGISVV